MQINTGVDIHTLNVDPVFLFRIKGMKKNDYFVIVYRLLSYFYACFQSGERPNIDEFSPDALGINNAYWCNIMDNLIYDGYIRGVENIETGVSINSIVVLKLKITSKGIEYLQNNSVMGKAKEVLKTLKDTVPGF